MIFDVFHIRTAIHDADGLSLNEIHLLAATRADTLIVDILLEDHRLKIASTADIEHLGFRLLRQIVLIEEPRSQQLLKIYATVMALVFRQYGRHIRPPIDNLYGRAIDKPKIPLAFRTEILPLIIFC